MTLPSIPLIRLQNSLIVISYFVHYTTEVKAESSQVNVEGLSEDPGWQVCKPNLPSQILEKAAARSVFFALPFVFLI